MAISQFPLNLERVCVRFYGEINPIESVKLPSGNYLDESKMGTSKLAVSKMAFFFFSMDIISPDLDSFRAAAVGVGV